MSGVTARTRALVAAAAALAVSSAGCAGAGSNRIASGPDAVSASGLTKAQYIAQLDAICEESHLLSVDLDRRYARLPRGLGPAARLRAEAPIYAEWAEADRRIGARLRAVVPAPEFARAAGLYLAESTASEAVKPQIVEAMRDGDVRAHRLLVAFSRVHWRRSRVAAIAFGFRICGGQRDDADDGPAAGREDGKRRDGSEA